LKQIKYSLYIPLILILIDCVIISPSLTYYLKINMFYKENNKEHNKYPELDKNAAEP
jgi:hypothetical protein